MNNLSSDPNDQVNHIDTYKSLERPFFTTSESQ